MGCLMDFKRVSNTILHEIEFQNPQIFQQTISLFPKQSTLDYTCRTKNHKFPKHCKQQLLNIKAFDVSLGVFLSTSTRSVPQGLQFTLLLLLGWHGAFIKLGTISADQT
jgi:hypothetical protein